MITERDIVALSNIGEAFSNKSKEIINYYNQIIKDNNLLIDPIAEPVELDLDDIEDIDINNPIIDVVFETYSGCGEYETHHYKFNLNWLKDDFDWKADIYNSLEPYIQEQYKKEQALIKKKEQRKKEIEEERYQKYLKLKEEFESNDNKESIHE